MARYNIIEDFVENNAGNESTRCSYRARLEKYFLALDIKNPDAYFKSNRDYLEDYKTFAKTVKHLAPRTQVVYLNTIKVFLEDNRIALPKREIKRVNVINQIRLAKPIIDTRTPDRPELKLLLTRADVKTKSLAMFLASTGMRIGEALGIQLSDIDWHNRSVRIRREVAKGGYARTTFFTPETKEILTQWLEVDRKKYIETGFKKSKFVRGLLEEHGYEMERRTHTYDVLRDGKKVKQIFYSWHAYRDGKEVTKEELIGVEPRLFPYEYNNAVLMWYNLLEKAGSPFNQKDGRYYMYNIHCLRRYWRTEFKVPSEFNDEKKYMMGHISGLDSRYFKPDFNKLKKVYDGSMVTLTLFSDADRVKSELQPQLNAQDNQLRKLMVENDNLQKEVDEMLNLMYYSTGEPPLNDGSPQAKEQQRIREVFRLKLEKRLGKGMA